MRWGLLVLCLAGCVAEPKDGTEYAPPEVYREWWARVEQCSGRAGRFERIEWYWMEGATFTADGGSGRVGMWYPGHRIYIAKPDTLRAFVVQHEMLHDLLNGGEHSDPAFRTCGLVPPH